MREPSVERWSKLSYAVLSISYLAILIFGFGGYFTFYEYTQGGIGLSFILLNCASSFNSGDILNNYCWDDVLFTVCRVLFCIAVLFACPIEMFAARATLSGALVVCLPCSFEVSRF